MHSAVSMMCGPNQETQDRKGNLSVLPILDAVAGKNCFYFEWQLVEGRLSCKGLTLLAIL